jgi:putative acetyltransferase
MVARMGCGAMEDHMSEGEGKPRPPASPLGPAAYRVRAAVAADVATIVELQEISILGLGVAVYGLRKARAWAQAGTEHSRDLLSQGSFFVAEAGARLLGVSGWSADAERPDTAWVRYVFVRPEAAGRGIGRRLVGVAESSALASGRGRLRLWSSLNAIGFYERLGYQRLRPARWPVARGIEIDYLLMGKTRPSP